jgi:tetratricopeptide (TPR) repeat protein
LLNQAEQKLFRRLALFAGGCTLESAEAVCDARRDLGLDILQGISSLMAQSLVLQRDQNGNGPRFVMLETLREYALERLIDSGESEATRQAHAAYALVVAEERNAAQTPEEIAEWLDLCGAEHDNFRAALAWLIETDCGEWALRLGIALFHFWEAREHLGEGREWLQAILNLKSAMGRTTLRARAASCTATLMAAERDYDGAFRLYREALDVYRELGDAKGVAAMLADVGTNRRLFGDLEAGRRWLDQALIAYRALGDRPGIAGALSNLAGVVSAQGDHAAARALFEEALSIFSELGDSAGVAWSYNHLGDVAFQQGDLAEARRLYAQGADIFHALTDRWGMAGSYTDLGYLACELREFERACSFFEQALRLHQDLGHMRGVARVFDGLACVAVGRENAARALTLAGAAEGLRRTLGAPMRTDQKARLERSLAPAWQNCGAAEAGAIWAAALAMPLDDAIRFAFQVTVKASTGT